MISPETALDRAARALVPATGSSCGQPRPWSRSGRLEPVEMFAGTLFAESIRRQLEDAYSSVATWIDGLMERMHPQFGHDSLGRVVAHLSDADDPLQCTVLEPEANHCRSGLGGQSLSPVGPPQSPADLDSPAAPPGGSRELIGR